MSASQDSTGPLVIVTGAGTGIGKAIALRLAGEGYRLGLLARDADRLVATAEQSGVVASVAACDIRDRAAVDQAIGEITRTLGPPSALVANSGIGGPNDDGPGDRFDDLVQTNLIGTYNCIRACLRAFDGAGRRDIVVISSILARLGVPGYTGYCASKAGLLGLVRSLAAELAPREVQVNAVCPGWVDTKMARDGIALMADGMGISAEAAYQEAMRAVPMGRMSAPEDIAGLVRWLLSADARGVTGQSLHMNNGALMF